jgi:hypothetical protein
MLHIKALIIILSHISQIILVKNATFLKNLIINYKIFAKILTSVDLILVSNHVCLHVEFIRSLDICGERQRKSCKGRVHTPSSSIRERAGRRERERERVRKRKRERERERERLRKRKERERCKKCPELLFLFLK